MIFFKFRCFFFIWSGNCVSNSSFEWMKNPVITCRAIRVRVFSPLVLFPNMDYWANLPGWPSTGYLGLIRCYGSSGDCLLLAGSLIKLGKRSIGWNERGVCAHPLVHSVLLRGPPLLPNGSRYMLVEKNKDLLVRFQDTIAAKWWYVSLDQI